MHYMGGKMRMRPYIVPILQKNKKDVYIEPFLGSGWIFTEMDAPKMIGNDIHTDLMMMWNALLEGWIPPDSVTEEEYQALRKAEPSALRGFVGFAASFSGKWFGGYARDPRLKEGQFYTRNGYNSILRKVGLLEGKDVTFTCIDYREIDIPDTALVYCDPPYDNMTGYHGEQFNSFAFWQWCREQKALVFISEYGAPGDFITVGEFQTRTDMKDKNQKLIPRIEKLFVHRDRVDEVVL